MLHAFRLDTLTLAHDLKQLRVDITFFEKRT